MTKTTTLSTIDIENCIIYLPENGRFTKTLNVWLHNGNIYFEKWEINEDSVQLVGELSKTLLDTMEQHCADNSYYIGEADMERWVVLSNQYDLKEIYRNFKALDIDDQEDLLETLGEDAQRVGIWDFSKFNSNTELIKDIVANY